MLGRDLLGTRFGMREWSALSLHEESALVHVCRFPVRDLHHTPSHTRTLWLTHGVALFLDW